MKLTTIAIVATVLTCVAFAFASSIAVAADYAVASIVLRAVVTAFQAAAVTLWG